MDERRRGQLGDELREGPVERREQLEQLAEAGDGVVGGQELREDVAAAERAGEDDAVLGGRRASAPRARWASSRPRARALHESVDLARDGDREHELASRAARADQAQEEQQRLVDRDLAARSSIRRAARRRGRRRRRDRPRPRRRAASPRRSTRAARAAPLARCEAVRRDGLDAERPEQERHDVGRRPRSCSRRRSGTRGADRSASSSRAGPGRSSRGRAPGRDRRPRRSRRAAAPGA